MGNRDQELIEIKQRVDLCGYLAHLGFEKLARKSSRLCTVMKRGADTVLVSRAPEGWDVWVLANTKTGGSVLDAAMHFVPGCKTLGHARGELRPMLGYSLPVVNNAPLKRAEPNRLAVQNELALCGPVTGDHAYLRSRGLPAWLLASPHLEGRVLDDQGAAVFVYSDSDGPSGVERRAPSFKGFSEGSVRSVFFAKDGLPSETVVMAEAPIDALSVLALRGGWERTLVMAFGGTISELQRGLVGKAVAKLPGGCRVQLCFDNDAGGEKYAGVVREIVAGSGRGDLVVERLPPTRKDFNEDLVASLAEPPLPSGP